MQTGLGVRSGSLDHYARLVCRFLGVATSTVSLIEADRQLFAGARGVKEPYDALRETPLSLSLCRYVVAAGEPLVVGDLRQDPLLAQHAAVTELGVVAYAGWPVTDASGQVVGSLCAADPSPRDWSPGDVSVLEDLATACSAELQHAHRLAAAGESLAQAIFDAAPVALAFFDDEDRLVLANERAESLTTPDSDLVGRALADELGNQAMEWIGAAGRQTAVVASSRRVRHPDESPWGTLVVAQDVTSLARALAVKDEFIATVSHELRTPLTTISACVELLEDEVPEGSALVHQILERMGRASDNLRLRIDHLLMSGQRRAELTTEATDLSLLVRHAVMTFSAEAERRGLQLRAAASPRLTVTVDPHRIEQAVENLVSNAMKYTPAGGSLTVTLSEAEDAVEIEVADTGVGMDADELDQAFDLFWRASASRRQAIQGIGVGLTVVRDIATEHRGSVQISSEPGRGTSAVLRLPRDRVGSAVAAG